MKKLAMEEKLVVRPIVGCLVHSHFWEGPCRAGHPEDMTQEAEAKAADEYFAARKKELEGVIDEVELMPMIDARYEETFVVSEEVYAQIEEDMEKADIFLCMGWRIPKLERYKKPVVIMQNGNEGIDFAAYCNNIGLVMSLRMFVFFIISICWSM